MEDIMDFEITSKVTPEDRNAVQDGLIKYNVSKIEDANPVQLGVYHRVDGEIKAGLVGFTHGSRKWYG